MLEKLKSKSITLGSPCAVEVVLTLAASSGHHGMIKPEGGPAGTVSGAFVSIITIEHKVNPHRIESISTHRRGHTVKQNTFHSVLDHNKV